MNIVYPLVIRPPPDATPTELGVVTPVGTQAAMDVTGHYRFFMYSRADEHSTASSGPSWAVGTQESVCSLFDLESTLHASLQNGPLPLQGPLGRTLPTNPALGGAPIPDGMVAYTISQRSAAAWELFSNLYNQAQSAVGSWSGFVNDLTFGSLNQLATSVGNQVVNCFSTDSCADGTSDWQNVTGGIAVSPDDIRRTWVTPSQGGTYGYSEPLVYVPSYFRHPYQWVALTGTAQVTVNVVDQNNNPVPNATVIIDGAPAGSTGSTGAFSQNLNPGSHDLQAQLYTSDGGIQTQTPPTPMTLSAIEALPACPTSSSAPAPTSTCYVASTVSTSANNAVGCPTDNWTQECLPGAGGSVGQFYSEVCACFPPPTPRLTCDVELSADNFVTVLPGTDVTFVLTLCTTCSEAGTPNSSCQEFCQSNADCTGAQATCNSSGVCASVPTIDVAIQNTSQGPVVCVKGTGFATTASSATLSYLNVPGIPAADQPVDTTSTLQILPDGTMNEYQDGSWVATPPSAISCPGDVTITLTDQVTGQTASFQEPAMYWCNTGAAYPPMVGDFCCTDPSLPIQPCP